MIHNKLLIILIAGSITIFSRFLPFIIFSKKKIPPFIVFLGDELPYVMMGMLIIFGIKDSIFSSTSSALHILLSFFSIFLSMRFTKNFILSTGVGTLIYILLISL